MRGAARLTVLVVDDDPRVRGALVHLLEEVGDIRVVAVDTDQAIRLTLVSAPRTDVAVVDVPDAGSPGVRLVGLLAVALPVVAVSLTGSVRDAALAAGALHFVEKDGDEGRLVGAIRSAAQSRRSRDADADRDPDGDGHEGGGIDD